MITVGPLTYNHEEDHWAGTEGSLCHDGLTAAIDTDLDIRYMHELAIYPQRPRCDVAELKLKHQAPYDSYRYWRPNVTPSDPEVVDEFGNTHEIEQNLADLIRNEFGYLADFYWDITFYVRALELGKAAKVISDTAYDDDNNFIIYADDGTRASLNPAEVEKLKWVSHTNPLHCQ